MNTKPIYENNHLAQIDSADGRFTWKNWNPDEITDNANEHNIWRMQYVDSKTGCASEPIKPEDRLLVSEFLKAVCETPAKIETASVMVKVNNRGICPKCHTYCDSDCEA